MIEPSRHRVVAALVLGLAACGTNANPAGDPPATDPPSALTVEAGLTTRLTITIAGDAAGTVYVTNGGNASNVVAAICSSSCTVDVAPGDGIKLWAYTPSTFAGWTGGCTSSFLECEVPDTDDFAATVTFRRDPGEFATLFLPRPITGLVYAPDGDLIVADSLGVSKLTLTGDVVWTTPIIGGAHDLATDAAGHIYGASNSTFVTTLVGPGLFALSPDGGIVWTRPFNLPFNSDRHEFGSFQSVVAASPDGTVIAAWAQDGIHVVDGCGADRFPTIVASSIDGVGVAPDGTVAYGTVSPVLLDQLDLVRLTKDGAPLATLSPLFGDFLASLAFDAANNLCSHTEFSDDSEVSYVTPDLVTKFVSVQHPNSGFGFTAGVAFDSSGQCIVAHGEGNAPPEGVRFDAFSPTGHITFTHDKPAQDLVSGPFLTDSVAPRALATDNNHHVAIGGVYLFRQPIIQVYTMP